MNTLENSEVNIGIDTSQSQLDLYIRPYGHFVSFTNNPSCIKEMSNRSKKTQYLKPISPLL